MHTSEIDVLLGPGLLDAPDVALATVAHELGEATVDEDSVLMPWSSAWDRIASWLAGHGTEHHDWQFWGRVRPCPEAGVQRVGVSVWIRDARTRRAFNQLFGDATPRGATLH
jgi:hypothetical protein